MEATPEKLKQLQRDFDNCQAVRETRTTTVWKDHMLNEAWVGRAQTFCGDYPHHLFDQVNYFQHGLQSSTRRLILHAQPKDWPHNHADPQLVCVWWRWE
jgi:hypothetical protein